MANVTGPACTQINLNMTKTIMLHIFSTRMEERSERANNKFSKATVHFQAFYHI